MRLAKVCVVALALALLGVAGVTGTQAHSRVVIRHGLFFRPHEVPISGNGDFSVRHLRWKSWGGPTAVGYGQAVEEERPSHRDFFYPARVTASRRVYCAALHRTVYNKVLATLLSPGTGVFGSRNAGFVSTCRGFWHLIG